MKEQKENHQKIHAVSPEIKGKTNKIIVKKK